MKNLNLKNLLKRTFILLLAALMIFGFAACSENGDGSEPKSGDSAPADGSAPEGDVSVPDDPYVPEESVDEELAQRLSLHAEVELAEELTEELPDADGVMHTAHKKIPRIDSEAPGAAEWNEWFKTTADEYYDGFMYDGDGEPRSYYNAIPEVDYTYTSRCGTVAIRLELTSKDAYTDERHTEYQTLFFDLVNDRMEAFVDHKTTANWDNWYNDYNGFPDEKRLYDAVKATDEYEEFINTPYKFSEEMVVLFTSTWIHQIMYGEETSLVELYCSYFVEGEGGWDAFCTIEVSTAELIEKYNALA